MLKSAAMPASAASTPAAARMAGAVGKIAGGDGDRNEEGREARAHQRDEGDLEAAVIRAAADGDAAEQRNEDHAHLAVAHHAERRHMAELVQRDHGGQHDGQHQPADATARTAATGSAPTATAKPSCVIGRSNRPPRTNAPVSAHCFSSRQFAPHREEAEHQEGQPAIAVGAPQGDDAGAVALVESNCLRGSRPRTPASSERIVLDPHGVALAFDDVRQAAPCARSAGRRALPRTACIRASAAALADRLGRQDLARPAGIVAERIERLPQARARRGDPRL